MPKFKLGELAKGKPFPEGTYKFKVHSIKLAREDDSDSKAKAFASGAIGYLARFEVVEGEFAKRNVFENLVVLDAQGAPSEALFRVAQFLCGVYGTEDIEMDPEDTASVDELVMGTIDKEFYGVVKIQAADEKKGYQAKNTIDKYAPVV
jgi:hypothetical protein